MRICVYTLKEFMKAINYNGRMFLDTGIPTFHLSMDCFWAEIVSGDLILKEHEAAKWLTKDELNSVNWLPADVTLIEKISNFIK